MRELTITKIYRDWLRVARLVGGNSAKGDNMRLMIRSEFKKNKFLTERNEIEEKKNQAIKGLSNYMILQEKLKRDAQG